MSLRRSSRVVPKAINESEVAEPPRSVSRKRTGAVDKDVEASSKRTRRVASPSSLANGTGSVAISQTQEETFKTPALPTTPNSKRSPKKSKVPPLTPTPSLVRAIRAPIDNPNTTSLPPLIRPADPHATNATLTTPGGTHSTAYLSSTPSSSPSKPQSKPTSTTGTLLTSACDHLISLDPRFGPLIAANPCSIWSPSGLAEVIDPFHSLVSSICGQQVSGAAAKSIKNKFIALFDCTKNIDPSFPTPQQVFASDVPTLRTAGLSERKAEYIHGIAEKFVSGELSASKLIKCTDDELLNLLIQVRGLGRWSVEMFACFALKRMDIISTGDLGVQRGMASWFGKDVSKLKSKAAGGSGGKWKYMSEAEMLEKSAPYSPYRSLFMWYMWRADATDISVMGD